MNVDLIRSWRRADVEASSRDSPGETEKTSVRMVGSKIEIRNVCYPKEIKLSQINHVIPSNELIIEKISVRISVNTGKVRDISWKEL